jgi:putative acetyltransferase
VQAPRKRGQGSLPFCRPRRYHGRVIFREAACITRQSTPTPKGVSALRAHLFLGAGYFHVRPYLNAAVVIEAVDPQGLAATSLLREAALEARALYPELIASDAPLPKNPPAQEGSAYFVAFLDKEAVGCGAIRRLDEETAEVRRMYVLRSHRRVGIARGLLAHLERAAAALGYTMLRLETGNRQHAAMTLYESIGFSRIPAFGAYVNDPTSTCYEKSISALGQP